MEVHSQSTVSAQMVTPSDGTDSLIEVRIIASRERLHAEEHSAGHGRHVGGRTAEPGSPEGRAYPGRCCFHRESAYCLPGMSVVPVGQQSAPPREVVLCLQ